MVVSAKITGIKYKPYLCKKLNVYPYKQLNIALTKDTSFILEFDREKKFAISWWVSAKRTRSYPTERIYNTLDFSGKKVTIIPIFKDEGFQGDRDFLGWDTISLMSLLGIFTIISYYDDAKQSTSYEHKITAQRYNIRHVGSSLKDLLNYQSDALHWNLQQLDNAGKIGNKAIESYRKISQKLKIKMHSFDSAQKRINELLKGKENFMSLSRNLSKKAQGREYRTTQPKEKVTGSKAILTIKNYLGGYYYFTSDEVAIINKKLFLYECKHSKSSAIPSIIDIKDGLLKMMLFTNLEELTINNKVYKHFSVLKLTSLKPMEKRKTAILENLKREAKENNFQVIINNQDINNF